MLLTNEYFLCQTRPGNIVRNGTAIQLSYIKLKLILESKLSGSLYSSEGCYLYSNGGYYLFLMEDTNKKGE